VTHFSAFITAALAAGMAALKGDEYLRVRLPCRTAEGRKCRLGEGGFGIVYKAVMNGVDEVAVKLVKVSHWA
jgi:hypothetical protein